jgi:putative hydrolase of the HAD superfamily
LTSSPPPIELVCFDLGGVLVRIQPSWPASCAAAGVPLPARVRDSRIAEELAELSRRAGVGEISAPHLFAEVAQRTGLTVEQTQRISRAWLIGSYPGVPRLIEMMKQDHVPIACLSNTHEHHWQLLEDPASTEYAWFRSLDHHFASHLLHVAKPDPEAYAHVERTTGIRPDRILFFDDTPENCTAARRRGWHAFDIDHNGDPVAQISDRCRTYLNRSRY